MAIQRLERSLKTHRICNRPSGPKIRTNDHYSVEVGPVPLSILDRRAGKSHALPKARTGIQFYKHMQNNVELVQSTWTSLIYVHQLCWMAYRYGNTEPESLGSAKQQYYRLQRILFHKNSIFRSSIIVLRYWNVISVVLRFAQNVTKLRGSPLCGNDRGGTFGPPA